MALQAFDKAVDINPKYALAWYAKGTALDSLGKYDEAIQAYDKAIQIKPDHAKAWYNKGIDLGNQGKSDEAIKALDKAIQIEPDFEPDAEAYCYSKGITLKRQRIKSEDEDWDGRLAECSKLKCTYWQDEPGSVHGYCQLPGLGGLCTEGSGDADVYCPLRAEAEKGIFDFDWKKIDEHWDEEDSDF